MSIQRWSAQSIAMKWHAAAASESYSGPDDYVLLSDHVAAVAEAEQRVLDENPCNLHYRLGQSEGLDAAREAVAALHETRICPPGTKAALAAIDALRGAE